MFTDLPQEFNDDACIIACTTFRNDARDERSTASGERYTVVTLERAIASHEIYKAMLGAWGCCGKNVIPVDRNGHFQPYESNFLRNGAPILWPFGDLPGNIFQGVFKCYTTKAEARVGHEWFIERCKAVVEEKP